MSALITRRAIRLSERDLEILRLVERFRLLSVDQIQRATITSGSPATRARRTRAVLQRLSDLGLLYRLSRQIGGVHAGSEGTVYRITGRGVGALARINGTPRRRVSGEPGERYIRHVLAIGEQAVRLTEYGADHGVTVNTFDPEPRCWRRYTAPHGGVITLRPDAFVETADDQYGYLHFLEQDMATESLPTIVRKCQGYIEYWRSGVEQQHHGVFPRVLWAVPTEHRRDRIDRAIHRLADDAQHLFVVAVGNVAPQLAGLGVTP